MERDYRKLYEEAFKRAKKDYDNVNTSDCERRRLETIFPELKDSEDERIRKELIGYFTGWSDKHLFRGFKAEQILAWLEKQGEQKPIDKVEPKFHAGDFITDGERIFQIKETIWERNNRNDGSTYCESLIVNLRDGIMYDNNTDLKEYHLWTIQDAKVGDVLYCNHYGTEFIVMNKGVNKNGNIDSYFRYNSYDGFGIDIFNVLSAEQDNITPATKEQRNLLFQKMKEAGYEWDAEKKELKKIEQNPTWSEEDERELNGICMYIMCSDSPEGYTEWINFLKSLKDRVQPQAKQEWSEEDEDTLNTIVNHIRNDGRYSSPNLANKYADFILSLKPSH